jgi:hypothetical protein
MAVAYAPYKYTCTAGRHLAQPWLQGYRRPLFWLRVVAPSTSTRSASRPPERMRRDDAGPPGPPSPCRPWPARQAAPATGRKVLRVAFRVAETGFDPAQIGDIYSRTVTPHIFEALYQYDPLARPSKVRPLTAAACPSTATTSAPGR